MPDAERAHRLGHREATKTLAAFSLLFGKRHHIRRAIQSSFQNTIKELRRGRRKLDTGLCDMQAHEPANLFAAPRELYSSREKASRSWVIVAHLSLTVDMIDRSGFLAERRSRCLDDAKEADTDAISPAPDDVAAPSDLAVISHAQRELFWKCDVHRDFKFAAA
jgi:hypothetical protein